MMAALLSRLGFPLSIPLLAAVLLYLPLASAADGGGDVREWMGRMSSALQELNYEGVFVHRSKDQMSAMHVKHLVDERGEHEYLTTLTGVERRVVRASGGFGGIPTDDAEGIGRYWESIEGNYELVLVGRDRVAGRFTRVILVKPKDRYRYGYRLWLEETTGLLLKSDLLDVTGGVIEQVMFTSIKLLDESEVVHPPVESKKTEDQAANSAAEQEPGIDTAAWQVDQLASGFALVDVHKAGPNRSVQRMTFSDGLASLSVFIEKMDEGDKPFEGLSRRGAVNAFGVVVDGYQVTVVGEVPEATVRMIGGSIRPALPPSAGE